MLTQRDIKSIEEIVDEKIGQKTKLLPSKDDFFSKMDELMGELKHIREAFDLLTGRQSENSDKLDDHEERIKKLEYPSLL